MVIPQIAALDALYKRVSGFFSSESFSAVYPDAVAAPVVTKGFPKNEQPFYVAVDEIVTDAQPGKGASTGQAEMEFSANVWVCARHADLVKAANTAMSYADAVIACVLADQTMKGAVDLAVPSITGGGTAADGDRKYLATEALTVTFKVWAVCPNEVREVLREGDL